MWPESDEMFARNDLLLLSLTRDGRLVNPRPLDTLQQRLGSATDCFLFCHGWLNDQVEAREGAQRFFGHLDAAFRPLSERVVPLRVALHWPSKPFANGDAERGGPRVTPILQPLGGLGELARRQPGLLAQLIPPLCEVEVPLGPEEELELDALLRLAREGAQRGRVTLSPLYAVSFWFMKRRAGQVGERLGRELLAPVFANLGDQPPRLHLIGHSFGAKLVSSAVLGGLRPASLVLLQAAFSAYAFAEEVPGPKRPGYYRPVITERMVADRIVALRSDHDRALTQLYPAATWGDQVDRAPGRGRRRPVREVVARRAMGAVGVLGAGATEMNLITVQTTGLPRGVTTVDGSSVVASNEWLIGAHRDIYHDEIATLVLLAAGLLTGSPSGLRAHRLSPSTVS
jgi:hypothetical protein